MRTIDYDRCIGCGKCISDCVNRYLQIGCTENKKYVATFAEHGRCIECGHCNAICPQGAVSGGKLADVSYATDDILHQMLCKRTIRKYIKGTIIPEKDLEKVILAGQSAPTNRNRKSARIILVKSQLQKLYDIALDYLVKEVQKSGTINPLYQPTMRMNENRNEILWNAEYLVVFVGLSQNVIDAAISAERMQLEANKLGVGTAYRGDMQLAINNVSELRQLLAIKSNEEALVAFAMGMTDLKYYRPAVKLNRKVVFM